MSPSSATAGDYVLFVPELEANVTFAYTPTAAELKKEIVVSEYGESSVIRWKGIYDYVTGALLREEVRGQ